ncbi:MAG: RNA ligase partner protein [Acidobacteria bacterium]|nr:RNA ligase partner protein [Acidobacteriota bacterium]
MDREKIVLDTSLFVNPEARRDFGSDSTEALRAFLSLAEQASSLQFFMPPSIFRELQNFVDPARLDPQLLLVIHQKPPSKHELKVPAFLLYELIEDLRERINKGLRVAEKAVRQMSEKKREPDIVQDLRRNYREALREGIIDSKEDVDLILLAKELGALLVTADQGVITWAEKLGIRWTDPTNLKMLLLRALRSGSAQTEG